MGSVSAHTLRHSFATHLYHNRAPIKAIRDLLEHQSLRSTSAYLHLDIFQLIQIYTNSHPKTRLVSEGRDGLFRICEPPRANAEKRSESREQEVGCEH